MSYLVTKRIFDLAFATIFIVVFSWLYILLFILASIDTNSCGIFIQRRIGRFGKSFLIFKFKTYHEKSKTISNFGAFMRKFKLDEIPQFVNVLVGQMSIVGPRPDIEGYYDQLVAGDRRVLKLKPGITSWASLRYFNEDYLLSNSADPKKYNDEVIFPDKVKLNLEYLDRMSLLEDFKIIIATIKYLLSRSLYTLNQ